MVLDLASPDASGPEVLREVREADGTDPRLDPELPIIVLTARGGPAGGLRGVELGADDCDRSLSPTGSSVRVGELLIDPARRKVMVGEREVDLAKKEFTLLRVLASDPTRVFSRAELLREVWGLRTPPCSSRTLDSHVSRRTWSRTPG